MAEGITKQEQKNWESNFLKYWKNAGSEFKKKFQGSLRTAAGGTFDETGGFGQTQMAAEYRSSIETEIKLMQALGQASDEVTAARMRLQEASYTLFGTIENGQRATVALTEQMRTFAFMTKDVQESLGKATMVLDKFGVNMSTTGEILDTAAMAFGFSQEKLQKLAEGLATVVYKFPGQASEIARNFQAAQSSLAYDSGKIMEVFKKLQMTSSTTGVSFNKLTAAFGESMDTFQGSATKAGNLNAILGRSVFNSIDLLGKTEAERVDTIVKGVQRSIGGDVNRLGKFQLKAVAEGMGLSVEDTRRLLSGQTTSSEVLKQKGDPRKKLQDVTMEAVNATKDNSMSLADLTKTMKSYQGILERTRIAAQDKIRSGKIAASNLLTPAPISSPEELLRLIADIGSTGRPQANLSPRERRELLMGAGGAGDPVLDRLNILASGLYNTLFNNALKPAFETFKSVLTNFKTGVKEFDEKYFGSKEVQTPRTVTPRDFGEKLNTKLENTDLKVSSLVQEQQRLGTGLDAFLGALDNGGLKLTFVNRDEYLLSLMDDFKLGDINDK